MLNFDIKSILIFLGVIIIIGLLWFLFIRKKTSKLIVVGNGFDLYHGIPSSYLHFRDYVKQNDPNIYEALEKHLYLQGDNEWNEFETNLANLDTEELLDEMRIYLGDQGGDWKDSMNHDFQFETERVTKMLGDEMQLLFLQWIIQLPIKHQSEFSRLPIPKDQLYLNFNYTNSLEEIYGISEKRILYIHGKAINEDSQIVLGHDWENFEEATNPKEITHENFVNGDYETEEDWQYTEAKDYIKNYFRDSYKNTSEIILKNQGFFRRLRNVEEIVVLGHSMTEVDWKYFKKIALSIKPDKARWIVSYYRKEDIDNSKKTLEKIGVDLKLVEFTKMENIFSNQMKLFDR